MAGGRPPKPTQLRILQGNPGKRPLNRREPQPRSVALSCPRWLLPEAKREWRKVAPELKRLGLATVVDRASLSAYCQAYARWRQAEDVLTREGLVFVTGKGYLMPRPEVAIAQKSMTLMKGFAAEFGFTPASRTRISLPEQKQGDPFAEFLAQGKAVGE